ncbi:hypothetical protein E8E14_001369 [Neopestalotiopsis sp. 37M]|nr:hypothetical protein E8E14_001369 [Neopestalotiopsis sp. 37M]
MKRLREPEEEILGGLSPQPDEDENGSSAASSTAAVRVSKITGLDDSSLNESLAVTVMTCSLPGHRELLSFTSYTEYETHYIKAHTNRCTECRKNFPSDHLLNLHIEECHDSFAAVLREKGEHTYSCFVEGCDRKCSTPQKRRMHLIDKHMYPKNFFFAVTKEGIDGRSSLLLEGGHRRDPVGRTTAKQAATEKHDSRQRDASQSRSSMHKTENEETSQRKPDTTTTQASDENTDTAMADLSSAMSTLQFVLNSVRFGRGRGRAGFSRR